jgi:RNA-directed DNA polymerase
VIITLLYNAFPQRFVAGVSQAGYNMGRFCVVFVILCRTQSSAVAALAFAKKLQQQHGLRLDPEKTRIVESSQADHGSGFDFLGYRFAGGRRYVKPKSLKALRDKVRQKTGRTRSGSLDLIIAELNPTLRGWFGYFKHAIYTTFRTIDSFVRRRLRAILRKREKRPGHGRTHQDHKRWPNTFFAAYGLFTLHEARMQASQSR